MEKEYLAEADGLENFTESIASILTLMGVMCPPLSIAAELARKSVSTIYEKRLREAFELVAKDIGRCNEDIRSLEDIVDAIKTFIVNFSKESNSDKRKYKYYLFKKFIDEKLENIDNYMLDEYETWMKTIDALSPQSFVLLTIFSEIDEEKRLKINRLKTDIDKYTEKVSLKKIDFVDKYNMELFMQGLITNAITTGHMWNSEIYYITDAGRTFLRWLNHAGQDIILK